MGSHARPNRGRVWVRSLGLVWRVVSVATFAALVSPLGALAQAAAEEGAAATLALTQQVPSQGPNAPAITAGDSPAGSAERLGVRVESLSLDMHLNTDTGAVITRAKLRVRNGGGSPLTSVALQLSSALRWQSARLLDAKGAGSPLAVQQYHVTTDTDHTGAVNELVLALPRPLAPGAELDLDLYYGGTLQASAERLLRLGAPDSRAAEADWDAVSPAWTGLRGFGNVLWFPVAAPAVLLVDGDHFQQAVTAERERTMGTAMSLALTVEHTGAGAQTAWFLSQPEPLVSPLRRRAESGGETEAHADADEPVIETAHWDAIPLDGHPVSLFMAAGTADAGDAGHTIQVFGGDPDAAESYAAAAAKVAPLLKTWLPARTAGRLTVLALPSPGTQSFADGGLLATALHSGDTAALAESLAYPMAAAALPQEAPAWVREGVPEFLRLLFVEGSVGRDRMMAELQATAPALQQAEASRGMDPAPLQSCVGPVCARSKAAYALVMLRTLAGDAALQQALGAMLSQANGITADSGRAMTRRFEDALQQSSGKDLGWFFADWFRADRGLPDLQIVQVAPRRVERNASSVIGLPDKRPVAGPIGAEPEAEPDDPRRTATSAASRNVAGLPEGSWLVAVEVQNNGDAAAEVPVTVRGGGLQNELPLRIPAHGRATIRVPFETTPEQVSVNDGTTPEQHATVHRRMIEVTQQR